MRLRIQSFPRPLGGAFKFRGQTNSSFFKSIYNNNYHAIRLPLLPKFCPKSNHRSYSIASSASSASSGSSSKDSSNSTAASQPHRPPDTAVKPTSKEEQEMELLLETAFTQAQEICQVALERGNSIAGTKFSSDTRSKSPPPSTSLSNLEILSKVSSKHQKRKSGHCDADMEHSGKNAIHQKVHIVEKEMKIEFEVSAAEALLKLTSHQNFQHAFTQKQKQQQQQQQREMRPYGKGSTETDNNVVLSLHHAFLCVIHWLCNTLIKAPSNSSSMDTTSKTETFLPFPSKESILLSHILSLTERSKALNLPLTLPLYECICTLIARHNIISLDDKNSNNLSLLLLDVSILARDALLPPSATTSMASSSDNDDKDKNNSFETSQFIKASFFANTLKELLNRNQFREMIQLFHGIKNAHNIKNVVDLSTGMELLSVLKDKVDLHVKSDHFSEIAKHRTNDGDNENDLIFDDGDETSGNVSVFDETDAIELAMILQTPVMEELSMRRRELEEYELGSTMGSMIDKQIRSDEDSEAYDDDEWDDATVIGNEGDYKITEEDESIDDEANFSNQISAPFKNTQCDHKGRDKRDDVEDEIEKLNTLVKFMENNIHDRGAREAAESAAIALLHKIRNNTMDVPDNSKNHGKDESSTITHENEAGTRLSNSEIHARFHLNASTGVIEKAEFALDLDKPSDKRRVDYSHYSLMKDMIYIRDATWEIPDVVPQLEEWNSNTGLFFSKDYEAELLTEITNEHHDDNFLDEPGEDE